MKILSLKPGHDGQIAYLEDETLVFSLEGEKDSFTRLEALTPRSLALALENMDRVPDVVCESGWIKGWDSLEPPILTGYHGIDPKRSVLVKDTCWLGHPLQFFSSSHERAHLLCAYGMSPFRQGERCYALVWEGAIGNFYLIHEDVTIEPLGRALFEPGSKYSVSYDVTDTRREPILMGNMAGRVMALAAYGSQAPINADERAYLDFLFTKYKWFHIWKEDFSWSPFYRIGVQTQAHKDLARKVSDAIFDRFYTFAEENLRQGLPLLISGGCGLNCEWNSQWRQCGLFSDVFVPPCTNDSGTAIGTAVDAQLHFTGKAKIDWDVYAGLEFSVDCTPGHEYRAIRLDYDGVANLLAAGKVVAWVQGRWEIGPRALGNRSLLASPFETSMRDRLNRIKKREPYRPVAPACLEEDVQQHFDWSGASPYMLHFQQVKDERLRAVSHVDNSARVQTVTRRSNARFANLLEAFKRKTGVGVLCNTSLNFPGAGFINTMSDLIRYEKTTDIDAFVVGDFLYIPTNDTIL